jgi:hypothetical protein
VSIRKLDGVGSFVLRVKFVNSFLCSCHGNVLCIVDTQQDSGLRNGSVESEPLDETGPPVKN